MAHNSIPFLNEICCDFSYKSNSIQCGVITMYLDPFFSTILIHILHRFSFVVCWNRNQNYNIESHCIFKDLAKCFNSKCGISSLWLISVPIIFFLQKSIQWFCKRLFSTHLKIYFTAHSIVFFHFFQEIWFDLFPQAKKPNLNFHHHFYFRLVFFSKHFIFISAK